MMDEVREPAVLVENVLADPALDRVGQRSGGVRWIGAARSIHQLPSDTAVATSRFAVG